MHKFGLEPKFVQLPAIPEAPPRQPLRGSWGRFSDHKYPRDSWRVSGNFVIFFHFTSILLFFRKNALHFYLMTTFIILFFTYINFTIFLPSNIVFNFSSFNTIFFTVCSSAVTSILTLPFNFPLT